MKNYKMTSKFSTLRRGLGLVALAVAGMLSATGAYALNVPAGTYYFDNTLTQWTDVYMRIGNTGTSGGGNGFVSVMQMSKMAGNSNIYYITMNGYNNATAVQFSAYSGYTNTYGGIYDGNNIPAKFKSEYLYASDVDSHYLFVVNDVTQDYVGLVGTNMPASLGTSYIKVGDNWYNGSGTAQSDAFNGASLGKFDSAISLEADVRANTADEVSATFHYTGEYATASTSSFSGANMAFVSDDKAKKSVTGVSVPIPEEAGEYSLGIYFQCGNVYDNNSGANYVATYIVPGLTGEGHSYGSCKVNQNTSYTLSLTDVYGASTVTATLSDQTYFSFAEASKSISTSVAIAEDHSGEVAVYFKPASGGVSYSATITFTLEYATGKTKSVEYTLSGYGKSANPICHVGAEATLLDGPAATVYGYLQTTGCNTLTERGFVYTSDGSEPSASSSIWKVDDESQMSVGDNWSYTTGTLSTNTTYKYKAYVVLGENKVLSSEIGTFTTGGACAYDLSGDTIYFTINSSLTASDACKLQFKTFDDAITAVKASPFSTVVSSTSYTLNYNIVFQVVPADTPYTSENTVGGVTGGTCTTANAILFNYINVADGASKTLVVRCAPDYGLQPSVQHPVIRNSRNIVFDDIKIVGSSSACYDNAIDIDTGSSSWQSITCGSVASANITIKNCYIYSKGFTCIHAAGYDGITFENNDIEASLEISDEPWNDNYYGASAKFIQCKNIKFLRNNFRGSHATSIWLQGVQGALVMNNVFWNSNDSYYAAYKHNGAFIRLVTQFDGTSGTQANNNKNMTFAYNTFYLADFDDSSSERDDHYFDFFRLGSQYECNNVTLNANTSQNEKGTIKFMYNNCYSFDTHSVTGANTSGDHKWYITTDDESNWCSSFVKNNFWSKVDVEDDDATESAFAIPSTSSCSSSKKYFINVENLMCSTACEDPSSLIIKGSVLNLGSALESDNSGLGDNTYYNDRLNPSNGSDAVRKTNGEWTLGAYQQSESEKALTEIIWMGTSNDWDDRNNWYKMDGSRVTCVDVFSSDLKVYIPAPGSTKYEVPSNMVAPDFPKFSGERAKNSAEAVNAGHGVEQTPSKFAGSIELEYGAALMGISNLKDTEARRYTEVTNHFEAGRKEWILVGTVVKPFTGDDKSETRLIQSGDYYIDNHEPHVYMNQASVDGQGVSWSAPFTSLEESVNYDQVFSIKIPDQYGPKKKKAIRYYEKGSYMYDDATRSKTFDFNGWFLNDDVKPEYKVEGNTLLCNTYPANIDIAEAIETNNGTIMAYDYDKEKNFTDMETGEIKSQNGFLFRPGDGNNGYFRITSDMVLSTSTKYKSAVAANPSFKVMVLNASGDGGSSAKIIYDELKDDIFDAAFDKENVFLSDAPTQPEISIELYGKDLDKVVVPDLSKTIPLKLVCGAAMTVEFSKKEMNDIETATLEDRETGKSYDLLTEIPSIALAKGTYTGRFYLNLSESEEPIPTDVDDVTSGSASIDIYGDSKAVIISSSDNVILKGAEITDMAGRTTYVELTGAHYNKVNISGAQGVYVVKAIGDVMSETTKVIVK